MMIQFIAMAAFICCLTPVFGNDNYHGSDDNISCNDNVQISIAGDCQGVSPSHFVEGTGTGPYLIKIGDNISGVAPTIIDDFSGIDWSNLIGVKDQEYTIIDGNSLSCWGTFSLETNVIPSADLSPCAFVEGSSFDITATLQAGATDTYTFEITDVCQSYNVAKGADGLKIQCPVTPADPTGWCTIDCDVEIKNSSGTVITALSGNGLPIGTYTVSVSANNPDFLGSYDLSIEVTDCGVPCENWCEGPPPSEFITLAELEDMLESSCMVHIDLFTEKVFKSGEICSPGGELVVVKYGGQYEAHGETVTVDLMTQAYRSLPIDLYVPGTIVIPSTGSGTGAQVCTGSGTLNPIFEFPGDIAINCGDDFTPAGIAGAKGDAAGWPRITDVHVDIPDSTTTCVERHVEIIIDTVYAPVEVSPGIWSNVMKVNKGLKDTLICTTTATGTFTNPKVPLSSGLYCNIFSTYEDIETAACGGGKKVVRYWKLIDWCTNMCYETKQIIEVTDIDSPTLVGTVKDAQAFQIDPATCSANLTISGPTFTDNCDDSPTVELELIDKATGIWISPDFVLVGEYTATYIAKDACGNASDPVTIDVSVTELLKPIAVCKDLVVSLTPDMDYVQDGIAKILAPNFDKGSHDHGCGEIANMEVIRMEDFESGEKITCDPYLEEQIVDPATTDKFGDDIPAVTAIVPVFGPDVKFCCADVGLDVQVVLRVYDGNDNYNDCMVNVTVQDKLSGGITCPNYTVSCLDFPDSPDSNLPTILKGSCDDLEVELISEEVNLDGCGSGRVLREWAATKNGVELSTCLQLVTVDPKGGFDPKEIKWPLHYTEDEFVTAYNKEPHPETGVCTVLAETTTLAMKGVLTCSDLENQELCHPSVPDRTCGLIGISHEDEVIVFDDEACEKIIRHWTVVDWCVYEPNTGGLQEDASGDTVIGCIDWCEDDACHGNYYFAYDSVVVDGYYTFDQIIKIIDDVAPTVDCEGLAASSSFDGSSCTGSITASAVGQDMGECPSTDLTWNIILKGADGRSIDIQSASSAIGETVNYAADGIAEGNYTVCFIAIDACGNSSEPCDVPVSISDTKAPTPICLQRLSTAVMQAGEPQIDIWAVDFNIKSEDNCTPIDDLRYSFSEDSIVGSMTFTCVDVTGFPVELQMWVWDNSDNKDFCFVEIRVEGDDACAEGRNLIANVAGYIQTEDGEMINGTDVMLSSSMPEYPVMSSTNMEGSYAFMDNPMYQNYELSADKNDDYMNGVSTLDLVLMNKHILGTSILQSPYKIIAADINNSGNVSASDLVQLRKLILGKIDELPNNSSWRFVDANQTFTNPYNPWPFTESIELINLEENLMDNDFVGVKIGDVNGTVTPNSFKRTEVRSNRAFVIETMDRIVKAGEEFNLEFTSENFMDIEGFQFTMHNENLEVMDISSTSIKIDNSNVGLFEGVTTFSYHTDDNSASTEQMFKIRMRSKTDGKISNMLKISSRITIAESYFKNDPTVANVKLEFIDSGLQSPESIVLYQNTPNPFSQNTTIAFDIPRDANLTLQIHDLSGKMVYDIQDNYMAGRNEIKLSKDILKSSGVYYYTLISDKSIDTKSMILLE